MKRGVLLLALLAIAGYCAYAFMNWGGKGDSVGDRAKTAYWLLEVGATIVCLVFVLAVWNKKK
jgi:uncharacterized integral membrane protein